MDYIKKEFRGGNLDVTEIFDKSDAKILSGYENSSEILWDNESTYITPKSKEITSRIQKIIANSFSSDLKLKENEDENGIIISRSAGMEVDGYGYSKDSKKFMIASYIVLDKDGKPFGNLRFSLEKGDVSEDRDNEGYSYTNIVLEADCSNELSSSSFRTDLDKFAKKLEDEFGLIYIPSREEWEASKNPEKVMVLIQPEKFTIGKHDRDDAYVVQFRKSEEDIHHDVFFTSKHETSFQGVSIDVNVIEDGENKGWLSVEVVADHGFVDDFKVKSIDREYKCYLYGGIVQYPDGFNGMVEVTAEKVLELEELVHYVQATDMGVVKGPVFLSEDKIMGSVEKQEPSQAMQGQDKQTQQEAKKFFYSRSPKLTEKQNKFAYAIEKWAWENGIKDKDGRLLTYDRKAENVQASFRLLVEHAKGRGFVVARAKGSLKPKQKPAEKTQEKGGRGDE